MRYNLVRGTFDGQKVEVKLCENGVDYLVSGPDKIITNFKILYDKNEGWAGLTFGEFVAKMVCATTPPTST
jgi:hypothetical protein